MAKTRGSRGGKGGRLSQAPAGGRRRSGATAQSGGLAKARSAKPRAKRLPPRSDVSLTDTWDLSRLFVSDEAWSKALARFQRRAKDYADFCGQLGKSAEKLAECLKFDSQVSRQAERLGTYAFLRSAEDQSNADAQRMLGCYQHAARLMAEASSFLRPEILAIPEVRMKQFLAAPAIKHYRLILERCLRFRPHTLSNREEELLAMQSEMAEATSHVFRQLLDVDMKFGTVANEKGEAIELTNATFSQLLNSPDRQVRQRTFQQYYQEFQEHQHTLAATLSGSVQKDVFYARARGHSSSLAAALFPDNVPQSVYDNLIASVRRNLPTLHRYYDVRRRKMGLRQIHQYDTYVPILTERERRRTWDQAVQVILQSLEPLGSEYCGVLETGLRGRWCDRYPNQGKQSGAFSCGSYDGDPYILMNYQPMVMQHVFTLTHEAGHSMHSYYSARSQPFEYYDYTIFVAEVASTFNERLLSRHLMNQARDDQERAYLINRDLDDMRGTIWRQTMFAEFEKISHEMVENGEPLTVEAIKAAYRSLLEAYFGKEFVLDPELSLESLRIPHFYRAFYVYKYATGMSAAIALSQRVLEGGPEQLADYLRFLSGGCSQFPLDLLRGAGVDMNQPGPIDTALAHFEHLVAELDELL